ncbi:MAG: beta-ketoacyl-[acyl-carrier-protein] synthase family protein [Lewinellaceae bacterium]|nr:beta-ketoacyl-[acyl-carrier-protein] synthase family protein [Lewinellaceae bacterium]
MKIYVTGIGVVSAIGSNVDEHRYALEAGRTGICFSESHNLMLGEVPQSDEAFAKRFELSGDDHSRTALLGLAAASECWAGNKPDGQLRTGLISATSVGGLDRMERYYLQAKQNPSLDIHPLMIHDNGRTTEAIARALGITGSYIGTVSTACSSGANAIMLGARQIESGRLDRVLVGGSDPIALFNIKGFSSLMIYDPDICKPFDDARKGLNLGEGAAFLLLENERSISQTGNTPLCLLAGWANATDAYHQTASSPEGRGATLTMRGALAKAGISPEVVSYVNAHGTGTDNNDLSESAALKNVFGAAIPPFSSTKGFTGHTLAAAGAIEAVFCVLSILSDATLPNLNFKTAMKETGFVPETAFRKGSRIENVLSNSFGFGGNCTSLLFQKLH